MVAAAALVGAVLGWAGHPVHASAAPLFGHVLPHAGVGTPAAIAVALAVIRWGPGLAERLSWRRLMAATWAASLAWTFALALIDGWRRGLAGRLTTPYEYLAEVPATTGIPALLRGFDSRILDGGPDPWTTHVAGHPPGALLVFVGLDRVGLGGGGWAAVACVVGGGLAVVAVMVTVRELGGEAAARAAAPFLALFPGAVWVGASADGLFAGAAAVSVALLALGLSRGSRWAVAAAGAGLAVCAYLSYGLVLLALPALAVIVLRRSRWRLLIWAAVGTALIVGTVTGLGFAWWEGYGLVRQRYYQGLASERPYAYWVWANLAAFSLSAGPAAAAILRRAVPAGGPVAGLVLAWAGAALVADLSGMSKAEVERIWLPFAIWLPAAASLLPRPDRRWWLAGQAATALLVNHLVLTAW
ncbi:hypothetical protein AB0J83_22045 [Actinoplanes sp. NPDC049596]|uniref:hypothetical protein n=1 Tax=unclassified Actinoplanes TaxID=2626549 RepID=UPI003434E2D1